MRVAVLFTAWIAAGPRIAGAGEDVPGDVEDRPSAFADAHAGAFVPGALSARRIDHRGLASVTVGWDRVRSGAIVDASAEGRVIGSLSLRAGASYDAGDRAGGPRFGARWDALGQAAHGVDVAVAAGYEGLGFNTVPAVDLRVALGRLVGETYLLANVGYGQGLELGERYGDMRLAALHPLTRSVFLGVDSRFRVDLERDSDEPEGEMDWEWQSGVATSYAIDRIVLTCGAGLSASRLRGANDTRLGPLVTAGLGTVF